MGKCEVCGRDLGITGHYGPGLSYDCVKLGYERSQEALAAARRECEGLRALLLGVKADLGYAEWGTPEHGANLLQRIIAKHHPRLHAALAAPAAGEEK